MKIKQFNYIMRVIFIFFFLLGIVQPSISFAEWITQTVDDNSSSASAGWKPSIVFDKNNIPHISYGVNLATGNCAIRYAIWTGSSWSIQTVEVVNKYAENLNSSIALDNSNNPHISYSILGIDNKNDVKYANWTGSAWNTQIVDSNGDVGFQDTSISLDLSGNPQIAYSDYENINTFYALKYAKFGGTSWSIVEVDTGAMTMASLADDSGGNPHIAYRHESTDTLKYASWTGTSWDIQTVDSSGDTGRMPSLAIDTYNNPHIAYRQLVSYPDNYALKYAKWTGTSWDIQTIDTGGWGDGTTTIDLDQNNYSYIVYLVGNDTIKYAKWNGNAWVIEIVASGNYPSFALDKNNKPSIVYMGSSRLRCTLWNNNPTISWTGEPNYIVDGVDLDTGRPDTTFIFRVKYTDSDNDAPNSGYTKVHIKKDGVEISGSPFTMTEVDPSDITYSDGKLYTYSINTLSGGTDYTYYFEAYDKYNSVASGNPTTPIDSPDVINMVPTLSWTGETNYVLDGLNPDSGDNSTTFTYKVKYTDPDNDTPKSGYPKVHIKKGGVEISGSPFSMTYVSGNNNTGAIYTYTTLLSLGIDYTYYFEAYDTYNANATGPPTTPVSAPEVASFGAAIGDPTTISWATKSTLPIIRDAAVAVVNNKMYTIGGSVDNVAVYYNNVEEYNPATNTWTTKAVMPTARDSFSVAVVNNKIYAIGGWNNNGTGYCLGTVEEYDPATNTWSTKASMPTPRNWLCTAVVNNKIYAINGWGHTTGLRADLEVYDPTTNTWTIMANSPTPRDALCAEVVNNKIYVIGGDGATSASHVGVLVEEYDPATETWTRKADMPTSRYIIGSAVIDNKIYIIGGRTTSAHEIKTVELYDPSTNAWLTCTELKTARCILASCVVNGKLYAVAGDDAGTIEEGIVDISSTPNTSPILSWTGESNYTTDGIDSESGDYNTTFTFRAKYADGDNDAPETGYPKLHIKKGGFEISGSPFTMTYSTGSYNTGAIYSYSTKLSVGTDYTYYFEAYDINDNIATGTPITEVNAPDVTDTTTRKNLRWQSKADMPTARCGFGIGIVNNKIYVVGGDNSSRLSTVEEYDPSTNLWATKTNMPTIRSVLAVGVVDNKLYAIGGGDLNNYISNKVEVYDPGTNTWTTKKSMTTYRSGVSAGVINEKIYVIGGWDGSKVISTMEEYDPLTDLWTVKTAMPTARDNIGVAVVSNKIYAIGGWNGSSVMANVEEYNPTTNTWAAKSNMPTARKYAAAVVINDKIYVIGGGDSTYALTTVEEYDPMTDTWKTETELPVGRDSVGAGVVNNKIYIIGGYSSGYLKTVLEGNLAQNNPPTISWTGENNYTADGVDPEVGNAATTFTFRIKYTDQDNDAPYSGYPKVHIRKNEVEIAGSPFIMTRVSGDYNTGTIYTYSTLLVQGIDYTYYFEAQDLGGESATGAPIISKDAPDVAETPTLSWTGEEHYINDGVNPKVTNTTTTVTFKVKYTDPGNYAPSGGFPKVHIKKDGLEITGSPITMQYVSGNYSSGALYEYSTLLNSGVYSYLFEASNKLGLAAIGTPTTEKDELTIVTNIPETNGIKIYHGVFKTNENERCTIATNLVEAGDITVKIYDTIGGKVKEMSVSGNIGLNVIYWDGKDDGGEKVSSGVYMVVIEGPGIKERKKVVVIK